LYHFPPKAKYWSKIAIFSYPSQSAFDAPLAGPRRNIAITSFGREKLECLECRLYQTVEKIENMFTRFDTKHEHDGQTDTDKRTMHDGIGRTMHSPARQSTI